MTTSWTAARTRHQRGFTLIELFVASGYFALGLSALVAFSAVAAFGSQRANDLAVASNLAQNTLETLRVSDGPTVLKAPQPQTALYSRQAVLGGLPTYFTVQSTATPIPGQLYYDLVVVTTWRQGPTDTLGHAVTMQSRVAFD